MDTVIPQAREIGEVLMQARLEHGYESRASLTETRKLRTKLTPEGLRKIERGERVPRLENLRLLCETLGISDRRAKKLERLALEANVQRVTRRAGNATVTFEIEGKPVKVFALPPRRKTEAFVRGVVGELVSLVDKYGLLEKDVDHFRRHARNVLLKRLT
jgi:transcriptional regulator with XRE-family HTH domain